MAQSYKKLVRDNIPDIIESNNEIPVTRILDDDEYKKELEKKLKEEYLEVIKATGKERIEELADMLEVIKYLAIAEGFNLDDVLKIAKEKSRKRGSFAKKIYLENVLTEKE